MPLECKTDKGGVMGCYWYANHQHMSFDRKQRRSLVVGTCHPSIGKMKQIVHPSLAWATKGDTIQKKDEGEEEKEDRWKKGFPSLRQVTSEGSLYRGRSEQAPGTGSPTYTPE